MRRSHHFDAVHNVAWNNADDGDHTFTPTTNFNHDDICFDDEPEREEDAVTMGDASSALMRILYWLVGAGKNIKDIAPQQRLAHVGARAEALLWLLNPTESQFESLTEIAQAAGITKQAVSKAVVTLREDIGLPISAGESWGTRDTFRKATNASIDAGVHWSSNQGKRKAA
jgi:biotin operon repressor